MTEEEKKAIEDLKKFMNKYEAFVFYSKQKGDTAEVNPHIRMYESYKNVLNLIEKQDKMIDLMAEDFATQLWKLGVVPTRKLTDGTEVIIDKEELIKIYERKYNLIKNNIEGVEEDAKN